MSLARHSGYNQLTYRKPHKVAMDNPKYVTTKSHANVDSEDSVCLVLRSLLLYSVLSDGTGELVL